MSPSELVCEIREIRGQELFHALPWIIEDQRRFVLHAFVTFGCGQSPRQEFLVSHAPALLAGLIPGRAEYTTIDVQVSEERMEQAFSEARHGNDQRPVVARTKIEDEGIAFGAPPELPENKKTTQ